MLLHTADITRETQPKGESRGLFMLSDVRDALPALIKKYADSVQCIYIDPPFATGRSFDMRVTVHPEEWKSGAGSLTAKAYDDPADTAGLTKLLRETIAGAKELLRDDGLMFLHVDWRMSGRARMLMDEIFGEDNLLNEIIWAYQTGGRATHYFSRKHDTIFMYRKTKDYYFDAQAVSVPREGVRANHMKRGTDADGRPYSEIRSAGKLYRYYDDEPVLPGDVWTDLNMQQKDPQRTGFETQKPLKLLERIILCSTQPGDIVCDLMSGSGTTADAACANGRHFIVVDMSPMALFSLRRRLPETLFDTVTPVCAAPDIEAHFAQEGLGDLAVTFSGFRGVPEGEEAGTDRLDGWAAGYISNGVFVPAAQSQRSFRSPDISLSLKIPFIDAPVCIRVNDIYGNTAFYSAEGT